MTTNQEKFMRFKTQCPLHTSRYTVRRPVLHSYIALHHRTTNAYGIVQDSRKGVHCVPRKCRSHSRYAGSRAPVRARPFLIVIREATLAQGSSALAPWNIMTYVPHRRCLGILRTAAECKRVVIVVVDDCRDRQRMTHSSARTSTLSNARTIGDAIAVHSAGPIHRGASLERNTRAG